jgi:hypothetical protein
VSTRADSTIVKRLRAGASAAAAEFEGVEDDDYRVYFLAVLDRLDWTKLDDRWRSALVLLEHDQPGDRDPIEREIGRLLVQVAHGASEMQLLRGEYSDRTDVKDIARHLRAATDRLHAIVDALTALHTLEASSPAWPSIFPCARPGRPINTDGRAEILTPIPSRSARYPRYLRTGPMPGSRLQCVESGEVT